MAFSYGKGKWIVARDSTGHDILTSRQKLDKMFRDGFIFEACISQASVVDSLVFMITFILSANKNKKVKKNLDKDPMGPMIEMITRNKLLDDDMIKPLYDYNKDRVSIVHHAVRGNVEVDFIEFYKSGEQIITNLNTILQDFLIGKGLKNIKL